MERVPQRQIAALEADVKALRTKLEAMVTYTELARTNATGADDFAKEAGNPKDRQRPIRRASPWGLSGRPVVDGVLSVIVKALGGVFNGFSVGITTDKYGPQDLKDGETCLWNKGTARVLLAEDDTLTLLAGSSTKITLTKDGDLSIESGGIVKLAGGGPLLARKGDAVRVTIPIGTVLISATGGVTNSAPILVDGTITAGSAKAQCG